jgi:hypothetical protein
MRESILPPWSWVIRHGNAGLKRRLKQSEIVNCEKRFTGKERKKNQKRKKKRPVENWKAAKSAPSHFPTGPTTGGFLLLSLN